MAITPQDIEQLTFSASKHGYNPDEVDKVLEEIAQEVDAMLQKIADLKGRLTASDQALEAARAQVAQLQGQLDSDEAVSLPAQDSEAVLATERQISQALIVAQQSADSIVKEAHANAERIRSDADQKAREVIRQALSEKQNELEEIDRLKASREEFRTEYKKMLQHFLDDVEVVFPANQAAKSLGSTGSASAPTSEVEVKETVDANATVYMPASELGDLDLDDLD